MTFKQVTDSNSQLLKRLQTVTDSNNTVILCLLHIKQIKIVITIYVHLFFILPWFSSVKLWENELDKISFPRTVREWRWYKILWFWRYKNYYSVYCTVYLDRSCLIGTCASDVNYAFRGIIYSRNTDPWDTYLWDMKIWDACLNG